MSGAQRYQPIIPNQHNRSIFKGAQGTNLAAIVRPRSVPPAIIVPPPKDARRNPQPSVLLEQPGSEAVPTSSQQQGSDNGLGATQELQNAKDFDCPIRAGPNGRQLCGWRPSKSGSGGLADLSRVRCVQTFDMIAVSHVDNYRREHVGRHGLVCTDCQRIFTVPKHYTDHRRHKTEEGNCSSLNAEKKLCPYKISLPPEKLETFLSKPIRIDRSDEELWIEGYKILHPNWEHEGNLPTPCTVGPDK